MIGRVKRFFAATIGRRRFEARLEAELADHLDRRAEALVAAGVPRPEAKRQARLELGGSVDGFKDQCRDARRLAWGDELARNLRHAGRVLRRSPGLTATIALTLGLCLGANAAVLSVINAVLFKPLPYPEPDRLAMVAAVFEPLEGAGGTQTSHDGATWEALRNGVRSLELAVFSDWPSGANALAGDLAVYLEQQRVGADFFHVLGVAPLLGRSFSRAEDVPGGPPVTVISHGLWQRLWAGEPSVVGRSLVLRGAPHEIVGVMPEGFRSTVEADLWTPLQPSTTGEGGGTNYALAARLKPGVSWAAARAEARALSSAELPELRIRSGKAWFDLIPMQLGLAGGLESWLYATWVVALLVLVVGAVNVAGLLLTHGARRAGELATRMALGGGRLAVVRQLLTECLAFALVGGVVGLVLGWAGMRWLSALAREALGIWQPISFDGRVLAGLLGLVVLTVLLAGTVSALLATRLTLQPNTLGGDGRVLGARNPWPRRLLVVGQLALVVTLLVGAGLLVRTVVHLRGLAPGCDPEGVMAARISLQDARYADPADATRLLEAVAAELAGRSGIERAAAGLSLPFERPLNMGFALEGEADPPPGPRITNLTYVTTAGRADFFATLGVPLLEGRLLSPGDRVDSSPVVVVNQAFVGTYFAGQRALGARIAVAGTWREVVGVVGDTLQTPSWGERTPIAARAAVFLPVAQTSESFLRLVHTWFQPSVVVKSRLGAAATELELRRALSVVDSRLPVASVSALEAMREQVIAGQRFHALLLALAAGLALALAAVGLGGLIAGSVTERRKELGIRMALGATMSRTVGAAALPGLALAAGGVVAGLALSLAAVRALRTFVFGVPLWDPLTFTTVPLLLLFVAALASLLPALAVLRLNPARTLRTG